MSQNVQIQIQNVTLSLNPEGNLQIKIDGSADSSLIEAICNDKNLYILAMNDMAFCNAFAA